MIRGEVITLDDHEEVEEPRKRGSEERVPTNGKVVKLDHVVYRNECVSLHDYATLLPDAFLNDAIVNFYLTWLYETKLSREDRSRVHIFSSHFFSKLKSGPNAPVGRGCPRLLAHESVRRWTKRVDIFSKKFVLVPICEEEHWYLIVICNPGQALIGDETNYIVKGDPHFLVLDSMGDTHSKAVATLRSYLLHEYWTKLLKTKDKPKSPFGAKAMPMVQPKELPMQDNSSDCGIFLLQYAETILQNLGKFFWSSHVERPSQVKEGSTTANCLEQKWFSEETIRTKRQSVADLLRKLADSQPSTRGIFPELSDDFIQLLNEQDQDSVSK